MQLKFTHSSSYCCLTDNTKDIIYIKGRTQSLDFQEISRQSCGRNKNKILKKYILNWLVDVVMQGLNFLKAMLEIIVTFPQAELKTVWSVL